LQACKGLQHLINVICTLREKIFEFPATRPSCNR
jgi:hypothetical protein